MRNSLVNFSQHIGIRRLDFSEGSIDKGEKILEILDDIGQTLVTVNKGILRSNENWGVAMLKRFDAVGIGIKGLANRMDSSTDFLKRNNDLTYNAVKRVDENLARKL